MEDFKRSVLEVLTLTVLQFVVKSNSMLIFEIYFVSEFNFKTEFSKTVFSIIFCIEKKC